MTQKANTCSMTKKKEKKELEWDPGRLIYHWSYSGNFGNFPVLHILPHWTTHDNSWSKRKSKEKHPSNFWPNWPVSILKRNLLTFNDFLFTMPAFLKETISVSDVKQKPNQNPISEMATSSFLCTCIFNRLLEKIALKVYHIVFYDFIFQKENLIR